MERTLTKPEYCSDTAIKSFKFDDPLDESRLKRTMFSPISPYDAMNNHLH